MSEILVDIRNESETIKKEFKNKDMVSIRELLNLITDLKCEIADVEEHYEEVIKHREQEIQDNYKQISPSEMYGI